ncbi:MAG: PAS domain S-box protein [Candidatus Viridilinea halotolerans]|uniref:histidine kinase n=1 Tax=Candidatus Viridilinea halotolerans TaxID=2491704 RepID=A0A426U833_9CHLR|nr:MAG: PAS domain S-box protein [Candidatus Viridilinea halotolerans]
MSHDAPLPLHLPPLEYILNLTFDAIVTVDAAQRIVLFNHGAERVFGYAAQEVLGQPLDLLIPERCAEVHRQHVATFALTSEADRPQMMSQQCEVVGRRRDGSEFPAEASIVKLVHHQQTSFTVVLRDISRRKRRSDELRQSEMRYRLLVDGVQDYAIYLLDSAGHIASWNAGAERMTGYQADEILGKHFACFFITEDLALGKPEIELQTARITGRYQEEGWRVRKDGSRFWANVVITAVHDERGDLHGFAKVTRDTTERRKADEVRRWYARRLHALYEISRAILVAQSPRAIAEAALERLRRIVTCHYAHIASISGTAATTHLLMRIADDCVATDAINWPASALSKTVMAHPEAQPVVVIGLDAQNLPPALRPLHVAGLRTLAIAPFVAHNTLIGELILARADHEPFDSNQIDIIRQIADQLAVALQHAQLFAEVTAGHERLQSLSQRLIEVQELERRMIAGELHDEIGQALTIVKLNLQALGKYTEHSESSVRVEESITIVEQALEQVRSLSLDLRPSLLDDLGLIAALRWYVARQARAASFVIHFNVDEPASRLTPVLETVCFRIVQEALTNIVRHARAREIWVQLRCVDDLRLMVRDDGEGFDLAEVEARVARGESFGLLGMRERANLSGGRLTITSTPGQGTTVSAHFPLHLRPAMADDHDDERSTLA